MDNNDGYSNVEEEDLDAPESSGQENIEQNDRIIALLSWLTAPIGGILIILLIKGAKERPFLFEHSRQSIMFGAALVVLSIILGTLSGILVSILPFLGCILGLVSAGLALAIFIFIVIQALNAFKGKMPNIPYISSLAKQYIK